MQGLNCEKCQQRTVQFTILQCDHVICAECLWSQVKTTLQGVNFIICNCGQATNFVSDSKLFHRKSVKIHDSSQFQKDKTLSSGRSASVASRVPLQSQQRPRGQVNTQLQFLDIQFKKSIEQAERNFNRIVNIIKEKYTNLIRCIHNFWKEEQIQDQTFSTLGMSSILTKKYDCLIGQTLTKLNDSFISTLASFRLQANSLISSRKSSAQRLKSKDLSINKENSRIMNYESERARLLKAIEDLKLRNGPIKRRKQRPLFQNN